MKLEVKNSVAGFIGIYIERNELEGTIKLSQKCLILIYIVTFWEYKNLRTNGVSHVLVCKSEM